MSQSKRLQENLVAVLSLHIVLEYMEKRFTQIKYRLELRW